MFGVTAAFPAEFPAKHHTPQDTVVPEVCQATQFAPRTLSKMQDPWPPVVTCVPAANCFATARAASALPATVQSKNVCPCPVVGTKPMSCSIWHPARQHPMPLVQQVPVQVRPLVQAHSPPAHACPVGHLLPHLPQLAASVCVSTQAPRQSAFPAGQTHCPALQTWAPLQAWPQVPQFALSVRTLVQALAH
jgi:hypothetical protein